MKIVADANIPYVAEAFDRLGTVSVIPGRQINASHVRDAALLLVRSVTLHGAATTTECRIERAEDELVIHLSERGWSELVEAVRRQLEPKAHFHGSFTSWGLGFAIDWYGAE